MADNYNLSDVFISYSRKDSAFVRKVFDSFKAEGKEVWADFEDIPKAADWWKEIQAGIDAADTFVFVISPDSVRSDICRQEVDHAVAKGKRFVPLLYRDVTEDADKAKIHSAISAHNWIFSRETDDYAGAFKTLLESVNTDLEHNRMLKRLLVRAMEWDGAKRNPSYALRGEDLQQAQTWLTTALSKKPAPMALHIDYINFSVQQQRRQERQRMTLMTIGLVGSLVLTVFALISWFAANDARKDAEVARDTAQVSERKARSLGLAASAIQALVDYKPDLALKLALQAADTENQPTQISASLAQVVYTPGTNERVPIGTAINSVTYNVDATRIAVAGLQGYTCIWNNTTHAQEFCLGQTDPNYQSYTVRRVIFDAAGNRLLSATLQGKITLWNVDPSSASAGNAINEYNCTPIDEATPCALVDAVMTPDARLVVFALADGRIGAWNAEDNTFLIWFKTEDENARLLERGLTVSTPTALALSSSGYRVAVGYRSGIIIQWYVTTGTSINIFPDRPKYDEPMFSVTALAYSPNGLRMVSGESVGTIALWDATNPGAAQPAIDGHEGAVNALVFTPDGQQFFSSSGDNSIVEWDALSGQDVQEFFGHEGSVNTVAVSPDGQYIVSGGYDAALRLWRTESPIQMADVHVKDRSLRTAAYHDGLHLLATGGENGNISLYQESGPKSVSQERQFQGYGEDVLDLLFTEDGASLITLYTDQHLMRRDVATGMRVWSVVISQRSPLNMTLMPDNKTLLVVFANGWGVYDWETGTELNFVTFSKNPVRVVAAHPNGNWIAVGVNHLNENLFLVDWRTGEIVRTYSGHRDGVTTVAFDEQGGRMVTGSFDTDVRIWETDTGKPLMVFSGHNDRVVSVQFVPQTPFVVSGSNDRSMRLWNLETGFLMYRYQAHTGRLLDVFTRYDGRVLISAGADGRVFFWMLPPPLPGMVAWARQNRYVRELTCAEANLYLGLDQDCTVSDTAE